MIAHAAQDGRFGVAVPTSFSVNLGWQADWELRSLDFNFSGGRLVTLYHATEKSDSTSRWVKFYDPDLNQWTDWQRP